MDVVARLCNSGAWSPATSVGHRLSRLRATRIGSDLGFSMRCKSGQRPALPCGSRHFWYVYHVGVTAVSVLFRSSPWPGPMQCPSPAP